jgi:hypothetical protein
MAAYPQQLNPAGLLQNVQLGIKDKSEITTLPNANKDTLPRHDALSKPLINLGEEVNYNKQQISLGG